MRKGNGVITRIPIPEELSDILCDLMREASIQMRGRKGDTNQYGLLLQPWYDEEEGLIMEANFAIVDADGFYALDDFLKNKFRTKGSIPFTTQKANLVMPDYNDECVKVRKGIHEYGVSKYHRLIMPPVYIDEEDMIFTKEYDD